MVDSTRVIASGRRPIHGVQQILNSMLSMVTLFCYIDTQSCEMTVRRKNKRKKTKDKGLKFEACYIQS